MAQSDYDRFEEHVSFRMHKDGTPMPLSFILLGLGGEMGELQECMENEKGREATLSEYGDVLWYLQAACTSLGLKMGDVVAVAPRNSLCVDLGYLLEMGKKIAWHGKTFDLSEWEYRLGMILGHLVFISAFTGISMEQAMNANIEKLEKRYPRGFVEGGGIREDALQATFTVGYDGNGSPTNG